MNMLFKTGPKSIGSAVESLILKKCENGHISRIEIRLFLNWVNIVGKEISQVAVPRKLLFLDNDMNTALLYITVKGGGAAIDIQYSIPVIIEKISMFFGFKVIHGIKIKQML
ncbi:hypothetical protein EHRUM1_03630 [Ehrlichia ruminantium]|uniref:DUF721 domain-containing protein n=1 Tax=Ehrlichia ruminantium TaxID=779 RepID=UPI0007C13C78|nr:DUF721 domain-containing protein [Ehrlichia ruminantium]QLK52290.1 DUF721 domain-containing protein [Ehrlichia ruminantium]QLK54120.1 DUF721 domain-containing protein [Ehrlichia ruminantium]QLK56871.1 DUF721 domain-containing protein [Ehrlichia ruminantium]QLK57783.1 DUF721 domain-containing protein [Ehrlichia ruminantium]UOD98239.1 DUF721 domain-containing protein [Ehrlichia ruminantium]